MKNRPCDTSKITYIVRADFRGATLLLSRLLSRLISILCLLDNFGFSYDYGGMPSLH